MPDSLLGHACIKQDSSPEAHHIADGIGCDAVGLMQGVYGAGAHTDYGALTVLATDDSPGLQINTGGQWHHVKPIPGTFIINLGDMLERSLQ